MHCIRRASSRLLASSSSFSTTAFVSNTASRSRWAVPTPSISSAISASTRFSYPSIFQARWNSSSSDVPPAPQESGAENVSPEEEMSMEDRAEAHRRQQRLAKFSDTPSAKETVYVGNLFFDMPAESLRKHMEKFGTVIAAIIVHDNRGMSKGFGYVQFSNVEGATKAIEQQHRQVMDGRQVVVAYAKSRVLAPQDMFPPSDCLYVGGIPYEFTDRDLQDLFKGIYNVTDIRVPVDRRTGLPRGFAHLDFLDIESATRAKAVLARKTPHNRKLRVTYAERKMRRSASQNQDQPQE